MKIAIIGTGFVGVTTAGVYASQGHSVMGIDIDEKKIALLKQGVVPFYEPELTELIQQQLSKNRLQFTTSFTVGVTEAQVVLVAVGTPSLDNGAVNAEYVLSACRQLAPHLQNGAIVVIKSTVPPSILDDIYQEIATHTQAVWYFATMPEFLREGSAVYDTLHPDRVVIGTQDAVVGQTLRELHLSLTSSILVVSPQSAQMIKYASNAYLAQRISFINQVADICEKTGAQIDEVIAGIGKDKRIGDHYWYPGFGYGGSCFPKDVRELNHLAEQIGIGNSLFDWLDTYNSSRIETKLSLYGRKIGGWKDMKVAVLGLAFKANTDDTRESPATKTIPFLLEAGAIVTAFDPRARYSPPTMPTSQNTYLQVKSISEAIEDADVIIALVEWSEITNYDFAQAKQEKKQWFLDARNQFETAKLTDAGYIYIGVGRGSLDD